jgi:hypothetical protein
VKLDDFKVVSFIRKYTKENTGKVTRNLKVPGKMKRFIQYDVYNYNYNYNQSNLSSR